MTIDLPSDPASIVLLILWLASELLGKSQSIKANGIFQVISQLLDSMINKKGSL